MLIAKGQDGAIDILSRLDRPSVIVVAQAVGKCVVVRHQVVGAGLRFSSLPMEKGCGDWKVLRLPLAKKLSQDQHHTPPKGYPTDKEDYAVPEYYEFPIDRKHIHAAISYFSSHKFRSGEHKKRAAQRILSRAKKYGVKVSDDSDVARAAHGK